MSLGWATNVHLTSNFQTNSSPKHPWPHVTLSIPINRHIILWLHKDDAPRSPADCDRFTTAEFPDPEKDPELYNLCKTHQIHGPCAGFDILEGPPCLKNGKCEHSYPKDFQRHTTFNKNFMPCYRRLKREEGGHEAQVYCRYLRREVTVTNRNVVPYNRYLLAKYKAHINVEIVSSIEVCTFQVNVMISTTLNISLINLGD